MASALLAVALLGGCASSGSSEDKYALYEANAGAPVNSFQYFGRINGWTSLGDSAVAIWTRPGEAWLLDLSGPCPDLPFATMIGVTSNMNRVSARFDRVIPGNTGPGATIPCHIQQIRPLDVKAIRSAEREQPADATLEMPAGEAQQPVE
ncbi:DUF6491 family protein [Luteimonas sp. BDR2-5]|uniref:DUF6491 family protein n=1 Tax=Proluteimonas luteida TaxID=2878685 RepID=UPI001E383B56|nr:DUF6491 family protein [Luteimonas sp. BDR2-5]MCD9029412.1 DUF6491 family protein [Luteimonas sp. BDR2-5]